MSQELSLLNNYETVLWKNKDQFSKDFILEDGTEKYGHVVGVYWNSCSMYIEYVNTKLEREHSCFSILLWEEFYEAHKENL